MSKKHQTFKSKKRQRTAPNRRWSQQEEAAIINFLKHNTPFEKPTAQTYYTKYLWESELAVPWSVLRNKVRNMRTVYAKAKSWENTHRINPIYDEETIKAKILIICPFFYDFEEIFGTKQKSTVNNINIKEENVMEFNDGSENLCNESNDSTLRKLSDCETNDNNPLDISPSSSACVSDCVSQWKQSDTYSKADMLNLKMELLKYKIIKMQKQMDIKEREVRISEMQLKLQENAQQLEEKKVESELIIRREELKIKEMLALKELEMQERIALMVLNKKTNSKQ